MYVQLDRMLSCVHLLWMLVSLAHANSDHADSGNIHPEKGEPPEIVVGFDIGMTHGTVSLGFTNGSFHDAVRLEAGPAYQARVLQRLQDEGLVKVNQSLSRFGSLTEDHSSNISYLSYAWRRVQTLLRIDVSSHKEPRDSDPAQSDLEALITGLKMKTEEVLQGHIRYLTVTTPRFLPQAHKSDMELALTKASLNLFSCHEIEDSIIASTIATQFLQHPSPERENISHAEWLLGPFRVEEVIAVLYTKNILALSVFRLYTGKTTWIEDDFRQFVAVGDVFKTPTGPATDPDLNFWNDVAAGMRKTSIWPSTVSDRTLRLIIQGDSDFKPEIVSLVESAFGELLPSTSQPYAVRMIFNEEELQWQRDVDINRRKAFTCVLLDMEGIWRAKDYEKDLLRSINTVNDTSMSTEGKFLASRGAAIMSLHFLKLPCEERQLGRKRPWEWDNKRQSGWFYGYDDEVEDKQSSFSDYLSAEEEDAILLEFRSA